jgi:hypothetical protein
VTGRKVVLGTLGAVVGAVIGAIAWAAITAATNFQIGYMAIGVGFLAGYGMRVLSGGLVRSEGIIAGAVALLGCVLGNLLTGVVVIAQHEHFPLWVVAAAVFTHLGFAREILTYGFNVMDLLFYAIAVYAGYRTALKPHAAATAEPSVNEPPPAS